MGLKHLKTMKLPLNKTTAGSVAVPITIPERVAIPLFMPKGSPAVPVVKAGDHVCVGTLIAQAGAELSAPVHSSVSGIVDSFEYYEEEPGVKAVRIVIDADGRQDVDPSISAPKISCTADFIEAVKRSGIVGLGGAGFPLAEKLASCLDIKVDTLIVNAAECEPYITSDYITLMSHAEDVLEGAGSIMKWLGIEKCVIVASADKRLEDKISPVFSRNEAFSLCFTDPGYPSGSEINVVYAATGRKLIPGRIAPDAGCLVCNVSTVVKLRHFLMTGLPLVTRTVTIDGSVVREPVNLQVPIGTSIKDILSFAGGTTGNVAMIVMGGLMMGKTADDQNMTIGKTDNSVLCFDRSFAGGLAETACINCGRCIDVCQMRLMPLRLSEAYKRKDLKRLERYSVMDCFLCGACSYVCPARKPLAKEIRLAQMMVREEQNNE